MESKTNPYVYFMEVAVWCDPDITIEPNNNLIPTNIYVQKNGVLNKCFM